MNVYFSETSGFQWNQIQVEFDHVMFGKSLFVLSHLAMVLYVLLRLMASDYPFIIVKLFLDVAFLLINI
jgi:hypothetical protein